MPKQNSAPLVIVGLVLFSLLPLYVLSAGPVGWLVVNDHINGEIWTQAYSPVVRVMMSSRFTAWASHRYMSWWIDKPKERFAPAGS